MLPAINHTFRINTKELRFSKSGTEILSLNLVASSKYKTKQGEQKEDVCWIKATAFGNTAKAINDYFQEKDRITIRGELKQESWTTQNGDKRSQHTIKIDAFDFVEKKQNSQNANQAQPQQNQNNYGGQQPQQQTQGYGQPQTQPSQPNYNAPTQHQQGNAQVPEIDIDDKELPF